MTYTQRNGYSNGNGQDDSQSGGLTRLTGLWKNQGANGKPYIAGSIGAARLVILQNDRKQKPTDPDYVAFIAPSKPKDGQKQPQRQDDF